MEFMPERKGPENTKKSKSLEENREEIMKDFKDKVSILAVAYHNLGVEQEFLKLYNDALLSYAQAEAFAKKYLGGADGITKNLQ